MPREMDASISEVGRAYISRWDRAIVIISIPHASAYGAFIGKFDLSEANDLSFWHFASIFALLPATAWWLAIVHDMLRSQLIMAGHAGVSIQAVHIVRHIVSLTFPIAVFLSAKLIGGEEVALIGLTLLVWWGSAWFVSTIYYLQMMKVIGVNLGE